MACPAVLTGQRFVVDAMAHIDCQAQAIGAYGYGALADPGSGVSLGLSALLAGFVALFGLRLMSGEAIGGRDLFDDVLKIAIVLTLATSWPAWRVLGYDMVLKGPGELAATISGAAGVPGSAHDLAERLQAADDGIVVLTAYGTGRNTGATIRSDAIGDSARGIALADQEGLADGRIAFLAGVLGPLAALRLGAGLLLALAPVMAGLLLFAGTRDLFFGWLRGLGALALGGAAQALVLGVELAILEPWLRDALIQREAQVFTPSVPTELTVITLAFALASLAILLLVGRIAFFGGMRLPWLRAPAPGAIASAGAGFAREASLVGAGAGAAPSRAFVVAHAVSQTMRREARLADSLARPDRADGGRGVRDRETARIDPREALGSAYRGSHNRLYRRNSTAGDRRDSKA